MKRGPGGTANCGPPPPAATARIGAPQAPDTGSLKPGRVIPGINTRKKSKKIVVESLWAVRCSYFLKV